MLSHLTRRQICRGKYIETTAILQIFFLQDRLLRGIPKRNEQLCLGKTKFLKHLSIAEKRACA